MRALELYAGIGGFSAACRGRGVIAAIELSPTALEVYRANYSTPALEKNIDGLRAGELAEFDADLWWLSPPCQPFTARGARRDDEDRRARTFLHAIELIDRVRPRRIALENVPGFEGSRVQARLKATLEGAGYQARERILCPTELGIPNRRKRYYLLASRDRLAPEPAHRAPAMRPLSEFLDPSPDFEALAVDPAIVDRYAWAMQICQPGEAEAITTCFTSAYGRSPVRSGAFLLQDGRVRRFSPREVARLLGFEESFVLPPSLARERAYSLLGNSLSIYAVRRFLGLE